MAKLDSALGISGIIMIILGILIDVVAIILLIINQNKPKGWYIWFLLALGTVMAVIGGVLLAIALSGDGSPSKMSSADTQDKDLM